MHLMKLQGDVGHVESHYFSFGDNVSVGARQVHSLRQTYHRLKNHIVRTRWYSEVTRLKWNPSSIAVSANLDAR
jgi:hypothetical protein